MSWGKSISLLKGKIFLIYYIQARIWHCCQRTQCSCFGWGHTCLNPVLEVPGRDRAGLREGARSIAARGGPLRSFVCWGRVIFRGLPSKWRGLRHKVLKHLEKQLVQFSPQGLLRFSFGFVFVGTYACSKKIQVQRKASYPVKIVFFSPIFQFPVPSFFLF